MGIGGGLGMRRPGWLAGPKTAADGMVRPGADVGAGGNEALGGGPDIGGGGEGIVAGPRAWREAGGAELRRRGNGGGVRLASKAFGLAGTTPAELIGGGLLGTVGCDAATGGSGGGSMRPEVGGTSPGWRDGGGGGIAARGLEGGGGGGSDRSAGGVSDAGAEILRPRTMPD